MIIDASLRYVRGKMQSFMLNSCPSHLKRREINKVVQIY